MLGFFLGTGLGLLALAICGVFGLSLSDRAMVRVEEFSVGLVGPLIAEIVVRIRPRLLGL